MTCKGKGARKFAPVTQWLRQPGLADHRRAAEWLTWTDPHVVMRVLSLPID